MSAPSSSYPGWAYLLAGIAMGLFIAFLFYLKNLPEVGSSAAKNSANNDQHATPTFDFYTILPELEIVVPEMEELKNKIVKPVKSDQKQNTIPKIEIANNGVYVLQIGSFKESQQADKLKASLALIGLEAHIQKVKVDAQTWHRVRIGPYANQQALTFAKQRLQENKYRAITLKISS